MCDCFHLAFPNWHAASSGTGAGRRLRGPEPGTEDDSVCDEPSQFTEAERPRPQGSSPVEEYPEIEKYSDSDKECEAEYDPHHKSGSGKKTKKSGLGSMFEKRSTPKMSKLKEAHSPESGLIVKTAKDGCAEGLIYGGGGKEGIFIKEVVPESPASKSLKLKEGDQILSATVYFDNVSYEDAIQILEHAQAYKVKLCLKRKPDITETEPAGETDVIPEEELDAPEIREQGKTKRRGDARISWPKFPSFGKGRKSRFTRSHSSSEADEQRKLELSPTTSDTESPIKSQDALKGKKRHKMKLSVLTKRGRISSSEDQDTDAPTGQTSGDHYQTASEMLSPECPESLTGEIPEDLKVEENLRPEQSDQKLTDPQNVHHKVELISLDSTLKTADLTVALADQESSSGIKSPSEKKKKKERSELKMKIMGKDKSHKKDAKAKASPKRLKTLGASFEIDQPENEKSDLIPGSESHTEVQGDQLPLDANTQIISSESTRAKSVTTQMEMSVPKVELVQKSPKKGEEKAKKGKDIKQKQGRKTSPTFKLPKIGLTDIAAEETIQKTNANVEESPARIEQRKSDGTEVNEDPYDRLSKSTLTRTQLPKREEIEIPGMEDMSRKITTKGMKEPKMVLSGHYEEIQAETVQLSIDVDSVKEAVSKLPGFKVPKVDTSGVPIPEEITVIDANAQRISVKTPTKVVDTKSKHDAHFTRFDVTASSEISMPTVKLPKITPADQTTEEPLTETKVDFEKHGKEHKTKQKQSDKELKTEVYKREDIVIPGKESAQEAILQAQGTEKTQEGLTFEYKSAATFSPKDSDKKSKKTRLTMPSFGIAKPDIRIPDIGIDFPKQNVSEQKRDTIKGERTVLLQEVKTSKSETKTGQTWGAISDVKIPEIDSIEYIDSAGGSPAQKDGGIRVPGFGVTLDATKPKADISFPETRSEVKDVALPKAKAEIKLPEAPEADITLGRVDVSVPAQKLEVTKPELEIKPLQAEHGQGSKFKMPKFGIKMPKIKGPEFDLSLSKKDGAVTLSEAKADVKIQDAPEADASLGKVDLSITAQKVEVKKPELEIKPLQTEGELDGQGSKFKMPKLGITMPKVKGPEIDFSLSKKDTDVTLPEAKAEVKLPAVELKDPSAKVEIKTPEIKGAEKDVEGSPSKFKMPAFKLPKFGAAAPNASFEVSSKTKDIQIPETQLKAPEGVDTAVDITASNIDMEGPSLDVKTTAADTDGKGSKFKMPKFGISLPKVKGPEIDLSLSKKDVDVTLPEAEVDVKLPEAEHTESGIKVDIKGPEIAVHQQDVEESPSKFKMPTFKLPKFGGGAPNVSVEVPDMDKDVKIDGADINISEEGPAVNIAVPSVDVEGPSIDVKTTGSEREGKGSKFKMPHLSFSMPKAKGPQISLTKKDVDVTLPEAKAKVQLPEAPEVDISCGNADVSIPEANLEVEQTELDTKPLHGEVEFDGQGSKFKMPKLGMSMPKVKGPEIHFGLSKKDEDVTLPEVKAEVKVPEVEIKEPFAKVDVKAPEAKASAKGTEGSPSKFKMPTFKLPKFGVGTPTVSVEVPDKDKDVKIDGADINISEEGSAVNIAVPSIEGPSIDVKTTGSEHEGKGSKFKMPHLSFSMPKVKGPKIDLSMPKKDVDITLPEAKADVKLPEVDLGEVDVSIPEAKVEVPEAEAEVRLPDAEYEAEMDGHGEKFKIPKFGIKLPKVKGPEFDLSIPKKDTDVKIPEKKADVKLPETDLGKVDVSIPEAKMELKKPELEVQGLQTEGELDGQGSKFKMPKFGIKMPKLKGPEFDLSLSKKDVDVTLPEAKAEVKLPDAPEAEVTLGSVHVSIPEQKMKTEKPELEIKPLQTEAELEGQGSKFKMPKFGIKMPKLKGPEFDLSLSKKDVNVTLPEAKAEVKLPDAPEAEVTLGSVHVSIPEQKMEVEKPELEIKPLQTEAELEGQGSKFKMPKFGIKMPKLKGPEFDLSLSKKDVDVTLPEAKAEVKLPDAPEAEVTLGSVHVSIPEKKMEVEKPELEIKPLQTEAELEGQGSKFKMPKFGIKMPKLKGPEFDLSLSKKDVDVTLPEAKADINLPNAEIKEPSTKVAIKAPEMEVAAKDAEGSPSKFKMPNLSFTLPKVKGPGIDLSLSKKDTGITLPDNKAEVKLPEAPKIDVSLGKAEVLIPEAKVEVKKPEVQVKTLQTDIELEGQGSKFKMPKLGITMPKVKGPEIDLSLSKKDADRTLPKAKAEVKLPDAEFKDPSAKVEIKAQLGHVEGSTNVTAEIPEMDKDIKVSGAGQNIDIEGPSLDVKMAGTEAEGKGRKFKMPKFGISLPKVQAPETDLSLSKKDGDFKLPEAKAEVKLPEAPETDVNLGKVDVSIPEGEVEVQKPGLEIKPLQAEVELDGQGSKFKMPKFGISIPKVKGPEIDFSLSKKDVDVTLPEVKAEVNLPDAELKEPSVKVEVKAPETEAQLSSVKGSPSKFKLPTFKFPKFGVASPNVSAELPGTDKEIKIDGAQMQISAPHTDVDVPEVKAEVQLPEVEVKESSGDVVIEQQPGVELDAKLKKPRFSLPRFSFSKPSVKAPEVDVNLQDVNVAIPQGKVEIKGGEVNMKQPEHEEEVDGQGSKFKMPKLGITMPKVTGPEIDLGLSKKDVDVTLPETKAEVKLPDVELKEPSAEVEIKPPEIKVVTKDTEESPSKFKMPTFKLPKFGVGTPSSTVKVPDMGKDVQIDGADIKIPEEVLTVSMAAPLTDSEGPSIEMEMTGTEHEGKGRKFKLPSLAFSVPQVKGPDIDLSLSKKDVDVTLPKADVPLPDAELKEPSAKVEIKAPETEVQTSTVEGSPSKFKMPTFKLPKFGAASPQVSVEVPDLDKDMKVDGADLTLPEAKADVKLPDVEIKEPEGSVSGGDAKLRKTSWTLPRFSFSKTSVKGPEADVNLDTPKVDVTLSEAKTEVHPPDIGIKESSSISVEGAPAVYLDVKLKKPRFSLPKISFSKQSTKELEVDVSLQKADVPLPEGNVKAIPPEVELKAPEGDAELDGQETKFKMPKFGISMSKVKGPDIDLSLSKKDVEVTPPKAKADFEIPEAPKIAVDVKSPEHEAEIDGQDSKFKMPKLGITMPKVKGPEIDLGLSKKDANVTLPEAKAEVKLPDVELKDPSAKVEIKAPEVEAQLGHVEGSPSKFKLPTFKLPKFGGASSNVTAEVPEMDKDINVDGAGLKIPKNSAAVDITAQSIDIEGPSLDVKMTGTEAEGKGSKFKMPKFGISLPKVRGPEIDLNLSKKDVDVTLPEAKAEVQPPDVKIKQPSAKVEIKAPEIEAQIGNVEGSPSKLKMPTFTLPKFGAATPKMSVPVPDVDKDIKIDGTKVEVLKAGATVDGTASSIDTADVKGSELEGSGSKFKMPQFGISIPKVKGPEIDLTLSKKDVDVTLPEAKTEVTLPSAEVKEPEGVISMPDAPTVEVETKLKRPNWTFPKFSFSRTGSKAPDVDVNIETPKADVTSPEVKAEVCLPDVEVKGTLGVASVEEAPAAELDASLKKPKFSLPRFSFSKPSVTVPEVSAELPHVDVSLPEGEVKVQQPEMEIKAPELEAEYDKEGSAQGSKFKLPKFGIALPKAKGPEVDLNASQKDVDITLPEVKAEVKLPEAEVKESSASTETEAKSKDVGGSPLKFKIPTLKMPKFGGVTYDVTLEAPDAGKAETDGAKLKEDVALNIKGPSVDIKTDMSKATISDTETPKTETEGAGHGSPSKFKLPSFKMPRLSFSRPKPEDEHTPGDNEAKGDQQEMEVEQREGTKSPKLSLTSFGEILKSIDVEFDVPKTDKGEENLETLKEAHETSEPSGKQLEAKEKETTTKQDTTKSPERTGWFKFPKFGLSSPSEPAKISEKDEHKDEKSPAGETGEEDISPTCSVQSSDAFADVSSTITSEHVGLSLSSPTKVTVKYSDPNEATGLGEIKSNIITSTTRTGLISFEPNVPEKITILSSGVSSSSEDTLKLESGKIHVITTNIQATPEAQHAKLLTAVQVQPAASLPLTSGANEAASWTVEESQGGKRTVFERRLVRETSSERSESQGTIVITKQITHIIDSSEPISGETASSIQRLRETVHSEKMRFFDGAEK